MRKRNKSHIQYGKNTAAEKGRREEERNYANEILGKNADIHREREREREGGREKHA